MLLPVVITLAKLRAAPFVGAPQWNGAIAGAILGSPFADYHSPWSRD